jgi:molybdate transport system ATP-binding protein
VVEGDMSVLEARVVVRRPGWTLDVDLRLAEGQTAALLGPNGAGKTTLVSAIAGLAPLDAGRIVLGDRTLDDGTTSVEPHDRRIGVVFQDYVLFPHLSVVDNIGFGMRGRSRAEARRLAMDWAARLDLTHVADQRPDRLSGGEAQRVALARALASHPEALLLDEPLSALDVTTRAAMRKTLAHHLSEFPGPRLIITHDPQEAFLLGDTIHVIEEGRIVQSGTATDIRLRPRSRFAADLAGTNLLSGTAADGAVLVGSHRLTVADHDVAGEVLLTIHPRAIALFPERPDGSPRNTWQATVTVLEDLGDRTRVGLGPPVPLIAEVTSASAASLVVGEATWVAIKATEIDVTT